MEKLTNKLSLESLIEILGLPAFEKLDDLNLDYVWSCMDSAEKRLIEESSEHPTEQEIEDARYKAEEEVRAAIWRAYHDSVMAAANLEFERHGLELVPMAKADSRTPCEWQIKPLKSWRDAANKIRETINGYGMFSFASLGEFLLSGPYTPMQAVLHHLGWMHHYGTIYGCPNPAYMYQKNLSCALDRL